MAGSNEEVVTKPSAIPAGIEALVKAEEERLAEKDRAKDIKRKKLEEARAKAKAQK